MLAAEIYCEQDDGKRFEETELKEDREEKLIFTELTAYGNGFSTRERKTTADHNEALVYKLPEEREITFLYLHLSEEITSYKVYVARESDLTKDVEWTQVVDYSKYACHSWQRLFFDFEVVGFVKVVSCVGTKLDIGYLRAQCRDLKPLNLVRLDGQYFWRFNTYSLRNLTVEDKKHTIFHMSYPMAADNIVVACNSLDSVELSADGKKWTKVSIKDGSSDGQVFAEFDVQLFQFVRTIGQQNAISILPCMHKSK